ncbi:MAG: plasmid replication initiator protein [Hamadaea sp.]|uniref:replication initiator n=1 Tax=Hamadaea sp. TaxID=2024425 RepID=UPI0017D40296|nr:replication initiator [Hamadaea sp.]NUT23808.1 plasmid replication initiator protein [Hamadaea sp.]
MNVSTPTVAPSPVLGAAPAAEPTRTHPRQSEPWRAFRPETTRDHIAVRAASTDMDAWYAHIAPAAACSQPVRLTGGLFTIVRTGDRATIIDARYTDQMPDGVLYKACGNRRASVCPACAKLYQQDAYQLIRAGLVGGKGVPKTVATHPAVFATLTAPSFGPVHTRVVGKHTCQRRARCDCRPNPCRARTGKGDVKTCPHGQSLVCFARHEEGDSRLGRPLCLDCYDHDHHVVWNLYAPELWRRTKQAAERYLHGLARDRGLPDAIVVTASGNTVRKSPVGLSHGKVHELQQRAALHYHGILRLDGLDPTDPARIVPSPAGFTSHDIEAALRHAAAHISFTTPDHPDRPGGWPITWGDPKALDVRHVNVTGRGEISDQQVAGYLAKYSTKSTEITGFVSKRLTEADVRAIEPDTHVGRLVHACWRIGRPRAECHVIGSGRLVPTWRTARLAEPWTCPDCGRRTRLAMCIDCNPTRQEDIDTQRANQRKLANDNPYARLRRWAHMFGVGGHLFTKARRYSVTFAALRAARIEFRRTETTPAAADAVVRTADHTAEETTLIVGSFTFAGIGWHNSGDALLANTSAALARARRQAARDALTNDVATTWH